MVFDALPAPEEDPGGCRKLTENERKCPRMHFPQLMMTMNHHVVQNPLVKKFQDQLHNVSLNQFYPSNLHTNGRPTPEVVLIQLMEGAVPRNGLLSVMLGYLKRGFEGWRLKLCCKWPYCALQHISVAGREGVLFSSLETRINVERDILFGCLSAALCDYV